MATLLVELQRRNVVRAAVLYIASIWALSQGVAQLTPVVGAPDWTARWFLIAAGIGFPFWIVFAWFYELTPGGIRRESEVAADTSVLHAKSRRLDFWIIGALSIAVVLLLTDRFMDRGGSGTAVIVPDKSVAVLPLVNESGDSNALYFSDGLSEAFIDALSQIPGLKVIARASSFQFRNSKDPVSVIGDKLGVAHLLEGSVQRAGDAVRISAELINSRDGTALWSQHYDRPYKDLFQLQDDITHAVAAALKTKLLGGRNAPPPQSDRPPSGNLAAYNAYLQGNFYLRRGTLKDERHAVEMFTAAVKLDERYAAAWAGLSAAEYDAASDSGSTAAQAQALPLARIHAEKAMALAPHLAVAHNALGNLFLDESNWLGAEAEYRRAVQLSPTYAAAKTNLAEALATLGRPREAVLLVRQALKLDPLEPAFDFWLAKSLMPLGRLGEAEAAIRTALALEPNSVGFHLLVSQIDILKGNAKTALSDAQREQAGVYRDAAVAQALQIGRDRAAAGVVLKDLIAKYSKDASYQIAEAYGIRKEADNLFAWLERARAAKDSGLQSLLIDPLILPHRHDPRFAMLCAELKLPAPKN